MDSARVLTRNEEYLSPWVSVIRKEVQFAEGEQPEVYHSLSQPDYVAILARTKTGLIPLVRQYRPAVEDYTWELPAGLVEEGESPTDTCGRELLEETGLTAEAISYLGAYYPDTGRLGNQMHAFFVDASVPDPVFVPESGLEVKFVTSTDLVEYTRAGSFRHQLHIGVLAIAQMTGYWSPSEVLGTVGPL